MNGRRLAIYAVSMVCAGFGAVICYDFGQRISGPGLGFLLAVNGAVFAALVAGMLIGKLLPDSAKNPAKRA